MAVEEVKLAEAVDGGGEARQVRHALLEKCAGEGDRRDRRAHGRAEHAHQLRLLGLGLGLELGLGSAQTRTLTLTLTLTLTPSPT